MNVIIDKQTFGNKLKEERKKKNYTKKQFADLLCFPIRKVGEYEKGKHYMQLRDIIIISNVLKLSIDSLINYNIIN